ncbi:MAG: hypothetical protein KDC88_08295, partial [Ignavibacteriae bacterium]|nr:hypothetical protein [Ignavibacteriota bacterium]
MIYKKYKLHLTLFLSIILISSCSYFMAESTINDGSKTIFKSDYSLVNKGKYATSIGELRVLVIFAAFKDDTSTVSESWKLNDVNLNWKDKIVNSSTELNFSEKNLTQYFYEMSLGKFYLYGDVYPKVIIPQNNQTEYNSISEVNHEILLSLDKEVDFSKYDNWSRNNEKEFVNIPDGQVDQIFIVYRNFEDRLFFNNGWTGIAQLYLNEDIITNDGVKITTGRLDKGSGIQSRGGKHGFEYMKYILAHEFGHFLLGAIHIENVTNLALMTGGPVWNASRGMNSWERYKLGWKDYI